MKRNVSIFDDDQQIGQLSKIKKIIKKKKKV